MNYAATIKMDLSTVKFRILVLCQWLNDLRFILQSTVKRWAVSGSTSNSSTFSQHKPHSTTSPLFAHREGIVSLVVEPQWIQINILSTKSPINSLPALCPLWRSCDVCSWSTKSHQYIINTVPSFEWEIWRENMGMWVAVGLHTDRKWGPSGIKVEVGNMQIACV